MSLGSNQFIISEEVTVATMLFRGIFPLHNYVQQDVDIFLNKANSVFQYIYNYCSGSYNMLYESLNQPTDCYTTVSTPITVTNTFNFLGRGNPFKEPSFLREVKTVCSYTNPLDYAGVYSCKFKKNNIDILF